MAKLTVGVTEVVVVVVVVVVVSLKSLGIEPADVVVVLPIGVVLENYLLD